MTKGNFYCPLLNVGASYDAGCTLIPAPPLHLIPILFQAICKKLSQLLLFPDYELPKVMVQIIL